MAKNALYPAVKLMAMICNERNLSAAERKFVVDGLSKLAAENFSEFPTIFQSIQHWLEICVGNFKLLMDNQGT